MLIFGLCFVLYFLKLSAGIGFWSKFRRTDPQLHQVAIKYQRSLRRSAKAQLDLKFLYDCKEIKSFRSSYDGKTSTARGNGISDTTTTCSCMTDAIKEKELACWHFEETV